MNKIVIIFILLSFFCCSCKKTVSQKMENIVSETPPQKKFYDTSETEGIVSIPIYSKCSNYNNKLSKVADDISFIFLDADPPINEFRVCHIELSDDYLFLSGLNFIMQFDKSGKYIKNIGRHGQGPEEYINIASSLQIDCENKLIYAHDGDNNRILVYNFDGTLKKTFSFNNDGFLKILNSSVFALRQSISDREQVNSPRISFMDNNGKQIKTHRSHYYPISKEKKELLGSDTSPLWSSNDTYYYLEYGTDTIFRISGDSLIPSRVLTGDLKLNLEEHYKKYTGDKVQIMHYIQRINSGVFESNRFMICRLSSGNEYFFTVYDKKNKQLLRTHYNNAEETRSGVKKMDYFIDDIVSGLPFNPQYQSEKKAIALVPAWMICEKKQEVLDHIDAHPIHVQSEYLKSVIQHMTEDDNPLVVIVSFK